MSGQVSRGSAGEYQADESRRQIYDMKDIIREYAPDAFVTLFSTNEIMGEGFNGVDVTVPIKKLEEAENKKPEK